jgi:hypothetical protein
MYPPGRTPVNRVVDVLIELFNPLHTALSFRKPTFSAESQPTHAAHAYFGPSRTPVSADPGQRFSGSRTPFQAERGQRFSVKPDRQGTSRVT